MGTLRAVQGGWGPAAAAQQLGGQVLPRNCSPFLFATAWSAKARGVLFKSGERVLTSFGEALGVFFSTQ